MNILHILHEFPLPPTSGIRCDMARRAEAFRALGHRVFVVCWASVAAGEMPSAHQRASLDALVNDVEVLPIGGDWASRLRRVWNLRSYPSYVAGRIPDRATYHTLLERITAFKPDVVWLEGVHPMWLAVETSRRFKIPLAYRAHNVEYRYVAEQSNAACTRARPEFSTYPPTTLHIGRARGFQMAHGSLLNPTPLCLRLLILQMLSVTSTYCSLVAYLARTT
jgi:hypothetical protein